MASAVVLISAVNRGIPQLIRLGIYVRSSLELRIDVLQAGDTVSFQGLGQEQEIYLGSATSGGKFWLLN
jgi:hypothetical protein